MATTSAVSETSVTDARKQKLLVRFTTAANVNTDQYDETISRLEKSGDWPPEGLEYHVAFRSNGNFRVSEVWDSREQFDAFGARLMPLLKELGIELRGEPEMLEVHNIVTREDVEGHMHKNQVNLG
jgi:hypothetical protein